MKRPDRLLLLLLCLLVVLAAAFADTADAGVFRNRGPGLFQRLRERLTPSASVSQSPPVQQQAQIAEEQSTTAGAVTAASVEPQAAPTQQQLSVTTPETPVPVDRPQTEPDATSDPAIKQAVPTPPKLKPRGS